MAAVAMLAMNSCEKENEMSTGEQKGTPVEFEMGINSITKTTTADNSYETTFAEGDEVGIFVYNGETLVTANAHYKLTNGKWVAQGEGIYAEEGVSYSYYAYYPYSADATDATSVSLSVATDQTAGYTGSDALMAKNESVAAGTTTVDLSYIHAFAMVQVTLTGTQAAKDATVTLQNIYPTAALNLKTGKAGEASGTLGTVAMKACSTNTDAAPFSYRAIVPAQTIKANEGILMTVSGGKNYKFTYTVDVPYVSGKLRQYNVTLGEKPAGTTIEIGEGTIANWTDADNVEGGSGSAEEIVVKYVNPFGSTLADVIAAPSFAEDTWFGLKQSKSVAGNITYSIEEDASTSWGKAATLSYTSTWNTETSKAVNNSWYVGTLGYYHCSTETPINGGIYKVTMKIKGATDTAGAISKLVFTCRNADNTNSFAMSTNVENYTATTATKVPAKADTWEEYSFYIDFSQKSTTAGTVPTTELGAGEKNEGKGWSDSTASDYAKIDLRIYTNNAATAELQSNTAKIYISDVVMEPYVAE